MNSSLAKAGATMVHAWQRFWFEPISATRLLAFRQLFSWSMLIYFVAWARHAPEWLTEVGYHPSPEIDGANSPRLPLLPVGALPFVGLVFFGALLSDIFGFARRVTGWILLAGAIYAMEVDPISAFTLNRLFVLGWLVLALAPEPGPPRSNGVGGPTQAAWPVRMLQITVVAQYFGSGLCKSINGDWWTGEDILWMQVQGVYMTEAAAWMVRTLPHWLWAVQEKAALWFELLAPLLFLPRLRVVGVIIGLGLHLLVALTMDKLIFFSLQMMCFYVLFVPPGWLERWAERTSGTPRAVA